MTAVDVATLRRYRQAVAILQLFAESCTARAIGDEAGALELVRQAAETDAGLAVMLTAAQVTGRLPHPGRDPAGWADFMAKARAVLAALEASAAAGGRGR